MEQESIYKNIAVIGTGASGGFVSILLSKNPYNKVTAFDTREPFSTLLPTGGGRCNITYDEDNIKDFVKNYPRGEKFLLSVFSKFDKNKTIQLFKELGINTYVQNDKRVFPTSNSAQETVKRLKKHLITQNFTLKKEKVLSLKKKNNKYTITTDKGNYIFDYVIISTGGNKSGYNLAQEMGHSISPLRPSLCSFNIREKYLYELTGVTLKDVKATIKLKNKKNITCTGDILFTHKSVTGPLIFKISSVSAYEDFDEKKTMEISLSITECTYEDIEKDIKSNSKKAVKNIFYNYAPKNFILKIMQINNINKDKQAAQLTKKEKEILINSLLNLKLHAEKRIKDSEIVTAGGIKLDEINSKTMESKINKGLYFTGEILDIDGFTGGFNLQNCWSTAYICSLNFN